MEDLTIYIILYLKHYITQSSNIQFVNRFKSLAGNFFAMIRAHVETVLKSLGSLLSKEMDNGKIDATVDAIKLIKFTLNELTLCEDETDYNFLKPILARILAGVMNVSKDMLEPANTIPALDLAHTILQKLK